MKIKKNGQVRIVTEQAYQSYWKSLGFKPLSEPKEEPKEEKEEVKEVKKVTRKKV
jgi:hypothetical protein